MIREFITGKIESISDIYDAPSGNNLSYRTITLLLPARTDMEKNTPQLFEDSLQDAIIDGVMTSDEAEEVRKKAKDPVRIEIIFEDIKLLEYIKKKDFVYIIAEPYTGKNGQKPVNRILNQGLFITKDANEFQKAKMNVFRDMEKERMDWRK